MLKNIKTQLLANYKSVEKYLILMDKLYTFNLILILSLLLSFNFTIFLIAFSLYLIWVDIRLIKLLVDNEEEEGDYYKKIINDGIYFLLSILNLFLVKSIFLQITLIFINSQIGKQQLRNLNYERMTGGDNAN